MESIKPPGLKEGDTIGVFSPSNPVVDEKDLFEKAKSNLEESLGVRIRFAPHAFGKHYYDSGTPEERLSDFHELLRDDEIKAILFSVGGSVAIDLVPDIDYELVKESSKIITGISDATTLLTSITSRTGLITFLGVEMNHFGKFKMEYEVESLKRMWFEKGHGEVKPNPGWKDLKGAPTQYSGWQTVREGRAKGRFVGGNLSSFMQFLDTEYELPFDGNILFFETYRRAKKEIHQYLKELRLRGVFDRISGMVAGYCFGSDDPEKLSNERPMKDLLLEVTEGYDFPVIWVGEIGHNVENFIQPIGAEVVIDAEKLSIEFPESVVS